MKAVAVPFHLTVHVPDSQCLVTVRKMAKLSQILEIAASGYREQNKTHI